jgi:hypothetical protein
MLAVWLVEPLESAAETTTVEEPMDATDFAAAEPPLTHPDNAPATPRAATARAKATHRLRRRTGAQPSSSREAAAMPAAPADRRLARIDEEGCIEVFTSKLREPVWPGVKDNEDGENVQVTFAGRAPQRSETTPLNAALAASVKRAVPLWPCATVSVLGFAVRVKAGASAVTETLTLPETALALPSPA